MTQGMAGRVAATPLPRLARGDAAAVEWRAAPRLVGYPEAVAAMEARAAAVRAGSAPELVWLLEHPPIYTAGTAARGTSLAPLPFPVHESGRGGQMTYHGPGQRIAYAVLDLLARAPERSNLAHSSFGQGSPGQGSPGQGSPGQGSPDLRAYVAGLERWLVATLARLGVAGERRDDRVGVWVRRPDKPHGSGGEPAEDKIAALGVRVRRGVAFHGVSLNVAPDLSHFAAITPCGIDAAHLGVTSLAELGAPSKMAEVDAALRSAFAEVFG